jgi:hypothetical protein
LEAHYYSKQAKKNGFDRKSKKKEKSRQLCRNSDLVLRQKKNGRQKMGKGTEVRFLEWTEKDGLPGLILIG